MRYSIFLLALVFFCCKTDNTPPKIVVESLSAFGEKGVNMVVEIPAGTNHKIEYDYASKSLKVDQEKGKDRVINFLPYPGNYGFVPGTLMEGSRGGDGDALDILVIAESVPSGSLMEVLPIAALELKDRGEVDTKLIAVPVDSTLRVIGATNFEDFMIEYNIAQRMIKDWFLNYKGLGKVEFVGWKDEVFARSEIKKWKVGDVQ